MIRKEITSPTPPPLPKDVSYSDAPAQVTRLSQSTHASAVSKVVVLLSVFLSLFVCVSIGLLIQNANLRREISLRVEVDLAAEQQALDAELEERERIADARLAEIKMTEEEAENERLEMEKELRAIHAEEERLEGLERRQALTEAGRKEPEELERKRLEGFNEITVAKIDVNELLNAGKLYLKSTLVSPFGESKKHFYFDELRGAAINLNSRNIIEVGRSEFTREVRIDSLKPLTISVMHRLNDNFLKDEAVEVQREWSKLRAEMITWNKRFPTSKLVLDLPSKKDDFHSFRQRLTAWEIQLDAFSKRIDEESEIANRLSPDRYRAQSRGLEEARSQLDLIHKHYYSMLAGLDTIANKIVYESGPVFYTSDGNEPAMPPGIEGREPFQFKFTIEHPMNSSLSTPVVEPVIPESELPFVPREPILP